jgi:hypothetical protein
MRETSASCPLASRTTRCSATCRRLRSSDATARWTGSACRARQGRRGARARGHEGVLARLDRKIDAER